MRSVERAVEWLRPLVDSKAWDYCVVWKLGDDPSRFFQWLGCCCRGGVDSKGHVLIKEEKIEQSLNQICRDTYFQHPIRTRACEALALFPSSMELYSGIHGEVVISNQPRWIIHDNSDHNPSYLLSGTQVLIPIFGGLIELFSAKNIPQDQNIIKLVMSEFHRIQFLNPIPPAQSLPPITNPISNPSLDSNSASIEDTPLKQSIKSFHSKNLTTERKRRIRIRDGLFALRTLVPKITKMDKAAILGDACDYIVELQNEVKKLEDELEKLEREEEDLKRKAVYGEMEHSQCDKNPMEAQVEVTQIGKREFLIKSLFEQRQGGFARLMEATSSSGLEVIDANVTTSDGKVLYILRVEANKDISPKKLRDSLIKLADGAQGTVLRRQKASAVT